MSALPVSVETDDELSRRMRSLGVREAEVEETFSRSSGPGGQKVNKTSTAVVLVHTPTGIRVRCETERSQARNRSLAWRMLIEKIEQRRNAERLARRAEAEKNRRRKRKRPKAVQERVLKNKARQSEKKRLRRRVEME